MSEVGGMFGPILWLVMLVVVWVLPIVVLLWFVRTMTELRRDQAELVRLVAAIEGALRGRRP